MASLKQKLEQAALRLAAAKSEFDSARADWDALYKQAVSGGRQRKGGASVGTDQEDQNVFINEGNERNASNGILEVLRSNPQKEWNYDEISEKLPSTPRTSIRVFLYKLQKDKKAVKAGRGKWRLFM